MASHVPSITKRERVRKLKTKTIVQTRYVVNATDPRTGQRKQFFFEKLRDAQQKRNELCVRASADVLPFAPGLNEGRAQAGAVEQPSRWATVGPDGGPDPQPPVSAPATAPAAAKNETDGPTVGDVVTHWLDGLDAALKPSTRHYYRKMARYILKPTPIGSTHQRRTWTRDGYPEGVAMLEALAPRPLAELTTADIRIWHKNLAAHVGQHTANATKKVLGSALAQAAEDLHVRVPVMPRKVGKGRVRDKKKILTPEQVGLLIAAARSDAERGLYYAFPFLTGVRPSEQLGLLWKDVDFARGVIFIRRMQELDGTLSEITKTPAGNRELPMSPLLAEMLAAWRDRCPGGCAPEQRVFSTLGTATSQRHVVRGLPLTYANFRSSYWRPAFDRLGLPYVSPHSARHTFISTLQANGIEVGLVAKLAGHSNATVTLAHYTQAVRGGEVAVLSLEKAYSATSGVSRHDP